MHGITTILLFVALILAELQCNAAYFSNALSFSSLPLSSCWSSRKKMIQHNQKNVLRHDRETTKNIKKFTSRRPDDISLSSSSSSGGSSSIPPLPWGYQYVTTTNHHNHTSIHATTASLSNQSPPPPFHSSSKYDQILSKLVSPAPQSYHVIHNAVKRIHHHSNWTNNNRKKSDEEEEHFFDVKDVVHGLDFLVKEGYSIQILLKKKGKYKSREEEEENQMNNGEEEEKEEVVLGWDIVPKSNNSSDNCTKTTNDGMIVSKTILDLAHKVLLLASSSSSLDEIDEDINKIMKCVHKRLLLTQGTDIRGRKSSDAAFCFAMAGITDTTLYDSLVYITTAELVRTGHRSSTKSKDVLHMVEKMAASGIRGGSGAVDRLFDIAALCLEKKKGFMRDDSGRNRTMELLREHRFDFTADRPLLWLWRFSARQDKIRAAVPLLLENGQSEENTKWMDAFDDPSRPLIVDVGCGMGVSLLGLASMNEQQTTNIQHNADCVELQGNIDPSSTSSKTLYDNLYDDTSPTISKYRMFDESLFDDWSKYNFVGCDLNPLFVKYANGIAQRWGISARAQFIVADANQLIDIIHRAYSGRVVLVMIQFPTPFSIQDYASKFGGEGTKLGKYEKHGAYHSRSGNSQLPSSLWNGFMVDKPLLHSIQSLLLQNGNNGLLLLQSNCEDVAVVMRELATKSGRYQSLDVPHTLTANDVKNDGGTLPQRTREWIALGGNRAGGSGWSKEELLPSRGKTETEVACISKGKPVHRCIMQPVLSSS